MRTVQSVSVEQGMERAEASAVDGRVGVVCVAVVVVWA
jgi:hypothetical protein